MTGAFWSAVGGFLANAAGGGHFLEKLFKHTFSQAWLEGVRGGNMAHGLLVGAVSVVGGQFEGENWSKAGKLAANAVISGTAAELGGGKFANGAITGTFKMLFNDMMHPKRPTFEELADAYPSDSNGNDLKAPNVYALIGGDVMAAYQSDPESYANACALRISMALNGAGADIPYIKGQTLKGEDGKNYIYRSEALYNYMIKTYGTPDISTKDFSELSGNKRVYIMRASYPGKFGAWGHASLCHGSNTYGKSYGTSSLVYKLYLWKF